MSDPRPFVFGLDLSYKSRGALAFAAWLRSRLGPDDVEAVHMIPARDDPPAERDERQRRALEALQAQLGEQAQAFARVQVREAPGIVHGVVEGLAHVGTFARALVLGRRARSGERALVHLGPVARKLLRALPLPTIVVPPDIEPAALAGGPVVLATDLEAHSESAARFAAEFARACGCPLIVVHVAEVHFNEFVDESDPDWQARREEFRREAAARLDRWVDAHDLDARRVALCGSPIELLLEHVERERAALLVLGSRRLSTSERLFTTSNASTMAAYAPCPVAVVPPPL